MVNAIAETASVLLRARSNPERLLDPTRLKTGDTRRKNRIPLNAERIKTNLTGNPGDKRKIIPPLRLHYVRINIST
jgi:hypothetical protein